MKTDRDMKAPAEQAAMAVQGSVVHITSATFEAPKAATVLGPLAPSQRIATAETLLEMGADHFLMAQSSAAVKLMEAQVEGLVSGLDKEVRATVLGLLVEDREVARKEMGESIRRFSADLGGVLEKYVDAGSPDGLPAAVTRRLEDVARTATERINRMLQDSDEGVLARQGDRVIKAVREELEILKRQILEAEARASTGVIRGRNFEEELTRVLGVAGRGLGAEVVRCGDHPGVKGRKYGDHLITLCGPLTRQRSIKVVVEAKDRAADTGRFSLEAVRGACRQARENRGADVAIFITETPELLPEGRCYGTVDGNFYLAYDPSRGDDTALSATLHMAVIQALLATAAGDRLGIDADAAHRELAQLRKLLEDFDAVESAHSSAVRYIQKASSATSSVRAAILNTVGRLDAIIAP
jgi:hypothetical protein